jgi:DNA polymerase III epsilon subunit-like protein
MKLLIFDTETTGLPRSREPSAKGPKNWPHIVSISWVILNVDTNTIEKKNSYIVKPLGWTIPEDSVRIHGITQERATKEGADLAKVIGEFLGESADVLVAHNIEFDYNVLHNAIHWDLELPFGSLYKKLVCTMELSRNICKLRTAYGSYKSPKLSELYEYVFKRQPNKESLHSSMYDVQILTEIIQSCDELRLKMNLPTKAIADSTKHERETNGSRVLSFRFD